MKRTPPNTDFILWMMSKQHLRDSTAAQRERCLRRLIALGTNLHAVDIENELIKTVPCYENFCTHTRGEYHRVLKRWQEYTRGDDPVKRTSPDTDFVLWIKTKQRVTEHTAARREGYLRRLITLGTNLHAVDIEKELIRTVPYYENLRGPARGEYRRAIRYWQEYTREMAA